MNYNNNNKEFVSLKDLYEVLKNYHDFEHEVFAECPLMISVKTPNGIVREYPVKQFALVAEGTQSPRYYIRNYKESELYRKEDNDDLRI